MNFTSGTSFVLKQVSQTHSAYTSWVSWWKANSWSPVHTRWNQKLHPDSQRMAWSLSWTSRRQFPQGFFSKENNDKGFTMDFAISLEMGNVMWAYLGYCSFCSKNFHPNVFLSLLTILEYQRKLLSYVYIHQSSEYPSQ